MFSKILIANRGEIACRVMRTARRLGIRTVAVYSEADAGALHVASADEAVLIGPAPARESYLNIAKIIAAAKESGAEAIHPGYGFLSENAAFAEACAAAGLVFIGPSVEAIHAMGSKSEAKAIMAKAGVPLVPGYHGADQADALLLKEAKRIGYPVLIKASAGGGGKGMRRVEAAAEFAAALAGARREAKAAFGDDRVLIERYVERPRHVEIQVFADNHGHALHLFERDCSIQRRHQKVIEEAPAPGMTAERRRAMGEAAVAAARAIGYSGAGTVEFLLAADGAFYFMEMNTRLQVEHPVTEMITGLDLVEWQLRVAAGEALPLEQEQVRCSGHAFEARLYAEDPAKGFLPATGRIHHLRWPTADAKTRIDTGIRPGDEISVHYDPMLAKLIVWGEDRAIALRRFQAALAGCQVAGVANNIAFLARVAGHPAFAAGEIDTHFIERHAEALLPPAAPASDRVLALATLGELLHRAEAARTVAARSADPWSPWHLTTGWRLNLEGYDVLRFRDGATLHAITVHYRGDGYRLDLPGGPVSARGTLSAAGDLRADLDGRQTNATILRDESAVTVFIEGAAHRLVLHDPLAQAAKAEAGPARLAAPMPGKVIQVAVKAGDKVKRGAALIVLEAMKMEHSIAAPADGTVAKVHYRVGDLVEEGAELLSFAETKAEAAS
jgi:3-methylcrotonyl-CoA carboxylase alpha subunit